MSAPNISQPVLGFFRRIVRGYFRRQFHAVRVSEGGRAEEVGSGPLILYANHSSWWDPMVSVLLAERLFPARAHYAPMETKALERYGILKRIGIFPVDLASVRGGAQFIRTGLEILKAGGALWVTPQGRFADPREPELVFKPGMAALAARVPGGCTVLPLAIEYTFWDERLPEVLLHFGEPVRVQGQTAAELDGVLLERLSAAMATLKGKAMARNAAGFAVLETGRVGTGGFYQFGQQMMARLRGRRYQAEHTSATRTDERA